MSISCPPFAPPPLSHRLDIQLFTADTIHTQLFTTISEWKKKIRDANKCNKYNPKRKFGKSDTLQFTIVRQWNYESKHETPPRAAAHCYALYYINLNESHVQRPFRLSEDEIEMTAKLNIYAQRCNQEVLAGCELTIIWLIVQLTTRSSRPWQLTDLVSSAHHVLVAEKFTFKLSMN